MFWLSFYTYLQFFIQVRVRLAPPPTWMVVTVTQTTLGTPSTWRAAGVWLTPLGVQAHTTQPPTGSNGGSTSTFSSLTQKNLSTHTSLTTRYLLKPLSFKIIHTNFETFELKTITTMKHIFSLILFSFYRVKTTTIAGSFWMIP